MSALQWLAQPASRLITASLLHFLWQGLAICLALIVLVELCKVRQATTRYACSLGALIAMIVCPLATFAWLSIDHPSAAVHAEVVEFKTPFYTAGLRQRPGSLDAAQPYALAAWLMGVALFSSRLLAGFVGISRLRRSRLPVPPNMAALVERLGHRLAIDAMPLVCLSKQVADAMAVGLVRPLVLIPAAWATEMPLPMLEVVIAHELAHLARRDLWVNLLQRIVETLLFYHPGVWWLSRRLRIERELCADELAVAATGNRVAYAKALEHIASQRQADIRPALAAFLRGETNMRILQRVRNILGQPADERSRLWPAGIITLALSLGLWAAAAFSGVANADDVDDERKKPSIKRERDDGREERRVTIRKKVPRDEVDIDVDVVEERVIKRDGKPVVEVQLARKELREDQGDRRIDELTALVKRLAAQVERLQDQVAQLRVEKGGEKSPGDRREQQNQTQNLTRRQAEEREELGIRKRELEHAAERIEAEQRALAEKQKAKAELAAKKAGEAADRVKKEFAQKLEVEVQEEAARVAREKAEVARKKAEAGREKAEAVRKAVEEKIRKLKESGDEGPEELEALSRKLLDEKSLLISPGDKPAIKRPKEPR
jgi:beta-lactamase regulating signal transducer with metallopeptidase domain